MITEKNLFIFCLVGSFLMITDSPIHDIVLNICVILNKIFFKLLLETFSNLTVFVSFFIFECEPKDKVISTIQIFKMSLFWRF